MKIVAKIVDEVVVDEPWDIAKQGCRKPEGGTGYSFEFKHDMAGCLVCEIAALIFPGATHQDRRPTYLTVSDRNPSVLLMLLSSMRLPTVIVARNEKGSSKSNLDIILLASGGSW